MMAIDEDDEFFLTLTNVGMIMRPDLFEQHTVHFHGYPNASAFYDGVPDASVAINIGASFTYYYLAPDAGTYFWHCHITPPEHLQMGMVGQLYVRPRQDRVTGSLYTALSNQQGDLRTACPSFTDTVHSDILCSNPLPAGGATANTATGAATVLHGGTSGYAYNDGDGSTYYDVEYPMQIHGFDPNFHFVGMTFNPEGFTDMKDKYFLLNGRSYPDTVTPGPLQTQSADGVNHFSQPLPAIHQHSGGRKSPVAHFRPGRFRISDAGLTRDSDAGRRVQRQTAAGSGRKQHVLHHELDHAGRRRVARRDSRLVCGSCCWWQLHDADGYGHLLPLHPNLDHLSNDAENFGGLMTEVHVN